MSKFSKEFPSPTVPTMPEYFKKNTLDGLVPGETIFPYTHLFKGDAKTGMLYVKSNGEIDEDAKEPRYFGERVGLMRVYETINGVLVDGYIADFRRVKPGSIGSETIHTPDNATAFDQTMAAYAANDSKPLLAAVFSDPDGNPHLMGDPVLTQHIEMLMSVTDAAAAEKPLVVQIPPAVISTPVIGPDYYHG